METFFLTIAVMLSFFNLVYTFAVVYRLKQYHDALISHRLIMDVNGVIVTGPGKKSEN